MPDGTISGNPLEASLTPWIRSPVAGGGDAPDSISNIIRHQQCALLVNGDAYWWAERISFGTEKACKHIYRISGGLALSEWYEDNLVTASWLAVPGAMLSYKHSVPKWLGQVGAFRGGQTKAGGVRSQSIIW